MKFMKLKILLLLISCASFAQDIHSQDIVRDWWAISSGQNAPAQNFDPSYQAVLTYATSQGYLLPSPTQQILQNDLVVELKGAGIWNLLDVFYVFATDGDSDYATLNWKNPTQFQCAKINSPTFTTNQGFNGNGTTSYLDTQWEPDPDGINYQVQNASVFARVGTNISANSTFDFGSNNAVNERVVLNSRSATGSLAYIINSGSGGSVPVGSALGFHFIQRVVTVPRTSYWINGTFRESTNAAFTGLPTFSIYICAEHSNSGAVGFSNRQISIFGAGSSLVGMENDLYTAWNTYFTNL